MRNSIILQNFCRKLHENYRIWTKGASLAPPPLDPPLTLNHRIFSLFIFQMGLFFTLLLLSVVLHFTSAQLWDPDTERFSSIAPDSEETESDPGVPLEQLCEPDAEIPDDLIQCGSCRNRCGAKIDPEDLFSDRQGDQCACDKFCGFHGDCCEDFQDFCPKEFLHFRKASEQYPFTRSYNDYRCSSFRGPGSHMVISNCPDGSKCNFTRRLNEDVNTFVPMYDVNRGVHYINGQCAVCNGAIDVMPWGLSLICRRARPVPGQPRQNDTKINSEVSLSRAVNSSGCFLNYTITGEPRPCTSWTVTSTCQPSCRNQELIAQCESAAVAYTTTDTKIYKNVYCALCSGDQYFTTADLYCGLNIARTLPPPRPRKPATFSMTLVFDFDPSRGLTVGEKCNDGEIYVPDEEACRAIMCPPGFVLDGSDCIPEHSNITVLVTGTLQTELTIQIRNYLMQRQSDLESAIQEDVISVMDSFEVTHEDVEVITEFIFHQDKLNSSNIIKSASDYSFLAKDQDDVTKFEDAVGNDVRRDVMKYLLEQNVVLETVTVGVEFTVDFNSSSEQVGCTWFVYQPNETVVKNNSVTILTSGKTYAPGLYELMDDFVIVCESLSDETNPTDLVLSILTLVCIGISILCLIARIVLQRYISSFQTKPGRIQLHMTIALLFAFVMLILGPFLSGISEACTTAGILLTYGFLAAFIWMDIIAVDTWLVFRPSAAFSRADDEEKSLLIHIVCGWGIPLILVTVSIAMNYVDADEKFKPEFGGSRCWYTQRYAMLLYFGVPIAMSSLLKMFLYVHTSINLHKAFKNTSTTTKVDSYHFVIYVKLFFLMGITWIFGFISAFTDEIVVDIIFVILTSLQGFFLFISFVCNCEGIAVLHIPSQRKPGSTVLNT